MRTGEPCQCEDCGKRFRKGDEGDNDRFCLRCQESSRLEKMRARDPEAYDHWLVFGDDDRGDE